MGRRKTNKVKLLEGRCQGIGADYVPFYMANEGGGHGTASLIPDPIEGRMIHCLSDTEVMMYYLLRWNPDVLHIREQFLLEHDKVNNARLKLGYSQVSEMACFTTDFLCDMKDGSQQAYSVKFKLEDFDPKSPQYQGRKHVYVQLIERQNTERQYWEDEGASFNIVTRDDLMHFRTQIKNIAFVMRFYDERFIANREQKLLYLIAHHIVNVPMDKEFINPKQLSNCMGFDIDEVFQKAIELKGLVQHERVNDESTGQTG